MEALTATCIQKNRDHNDKILSYVIKDAQGNQRIIYPNELKRAIFTNQINITNLKLTSDNRLIDSDDSKEQIMNKLKDVQTIESLDAAYALCKTMKETCSWIVTEAIYDSYTPIPTFRMKLRDDGLWLSNSDRLGNCKCNLGIADSLLIQVKCKAKKSVNSRTGNPVILMDYEFESFVEKVPRHGKSSTYKTEFNSYLDKYINTISNNIEIGACSVDHNMGRSIEQVLNKHEAGGSLRAYNQDELVSISQATIAWKIITFIMNVGFGINDYERYLNDIKMYGGNTEIIDKEISDIDKEVKNTRLAGSLLNKEKIGIYGKISKDEAMQANKYLYNKEKGIKGLLGQFKR